MVIYIVLPLFLLLIVKYKGQDYVFLALLVLFTINILRDYSVGYDYGHNYKRNYDNESIVYQKDVIDVESLLYLEKDSVEIGWSLLKRIGKVNSLPFSFVNFLAAIIIFVALAISIKQSPWPILSILLYVLLFRYYATFNTIRQSIAAIIFVASIPFIIRRQFLKYLLCCLLAASFHLSALLMIVFYYLPKIHISFKTSILLIIASFALSALNVDKLLFSWIFDSGYMFASYAKYLTIENEYSYPIIFLYVPAILLFIPYILLNYKSKVKHLDVYQLLFVISIIISVLSIHYEVLFRFNEYFRNSLVIAIPLLFKSRTNYLFTLRHCVVIGCCLGIYSIYLYLNANAIWPYSLIFFSNYS